MKRISHFLSPCRISSNPKILAYGSLCQPREKDREAVFPVCLPSRNHWSAREASCSAHYHRHRPQQHRKRTARTVRLRLSRPPPCFMHGIAPTDPSHATLAIPVENSPLYRSKIPHPYPSSPGPESLWR